MKIDWFCDSWISNVYDKANRLSVKAVKLGQTQRLGTRYKPTKRFGEHLKGIDFRTILLQRDNVTLQRFIAQTKHNKIIFKGSQNSDHILVFVYDALNLTSIYPVMRNAQISTVYVKSWKTTL